VKRPLRRTPATQAARPPVVFISGATGGIGAAASVAYAGMGAHLAILGTNRANLEALRSRLEAKGTEVLPLVADVTSHRQVQNAVERTVKRFGRIDVLLNNAGINVRKPFLELTVNEWDRVISVNLKGVFLVAQAVARQMVRQKAGVIINTASVASFMGRNNIAAYGASKGGVEMLSKCMAMELAEQGVRVNTISPGMVSTPLTDAFINSDRGRRKRAIMSAIPLGRLARPEDLTGALLFLASPAAAYVTGQTIVIDGGWTTGLRT